MSIGANPKKTLQVAQSHTLLRTSKKGERFVGTCTLCGRKGLTMADMKTPCRNLPRISQEQSLLDVWNHLKSKQ